MTSLDKVMIHGRRAARVIRADIGGVRRRQGGNRKMRQGEWRQGSAAEWLWSPEPMRWRRTYSGRPDQVTAARVFAASLFAGTAREEDVAVVVAELATNAVRHTRSGEYRGWFGLEVTLAELAYISVTDLGGGGVPTVCPQPAGSDLECGKRGLVIVSKLAVSIGVHGSVRTGHTVWADVSLLDTGEDKVGCEENTLAS
ncbi:ATP-binding protein [Actinomadura sp. 21ATH]|uniref:ATP-binding protein n=1 Tax=Actinomadura sp. 21ATH TaxID=1735444 RepID=UPI0035C16CCA